MITLSLGTIIFCSILIKYACDSFEKASYHLGRHVFRMPPGVRGATLEAIGSSMPELLTTFFLLFLYQDLGGFSAGIATCAGSAVFNAVVIPALCILAVTLKSRAFPRPLPFIRLDRSVIWRDGLFFLAAELALIYCLAQTALSWWMGALLGSIYLVYFAVLLKQMRGNRARMGEEESEEPVLEERRSRWMAMIKLDWHTILFNGRPFSAGSAWTVLVMAIVSLSFACYLLADAVMQSAAALNVPAYFTAVILGAAATSVPDTFISVKNALKGDYDDAVANAVGSNIFDICIALGLPLALYGLFYGDVQMIGIEGMSSADIQTLRIALLGVTVAVLFLFLSGRRDGPANRIGKGRAFVLLSVYLVWNLMIFAQATGWSGMPNI